MEFFDYYLTALRNWKDFEGRTDRKSYWMFVLVNVLISSLVRVFDSIMPTGNYSIYGLYTLILFVPGIAIAVRRLHDIGKSGWWMLIILIPVIGWIWLIILLAQEGKS